MAEEKQNKKSPFKDTDEFEKEIIEFLNKHKTKVREHSKRISDYFEMCCFNYVVRFYENIGFEVTAENLIKGKYRYKCSTQGVQSNFSFFKATRMIQENKQVFDIHHNLAVQSSFNPQIFTTPDIVVINEGKVSEDDMFYSTKKRFCFVENHDLQTFCEVKQFNPFPELLFNFIGTLNELKHELIDEYKNNENEYKDSPHLAPSLMISGKSNDHAERIRESLESRYNINILYDLFEIGLRTFSKKHIDNLNIMKSRIEKQKQL